MSFREKMSFFWSFAQKYKKVFNLLAVISLAVAIIGSLTPYFFGKMIDSVLKQELWCGLNYWQIALVWGSLNLFVLALNLTRNAKTIIYNRYLQMDMLSSFCQHALDLPIAYHYNKKPGETSKIIDRGVDTANRLVELAYFRFAPTLLPIIVALVIMFSLGWRIPVAMIVTMVVFFLVSVYYQMDNILNCQKVVNQNYNRLYGHMGDFLGNIGDVKINTNEALEIERQKENFLEVIKVLRESRTYWTRLGAVQGILLTVSQVSIMAYAIFLLSQGRLTAGLVAMLIGYLGRIFGPLNMLVDDIRGLRRELVDLEDAMKLAGEKQEDDEALAQDHELNGEIEFNKVYFCYPERDDGVVDGLNFRILPGQKVAIFGKTGCGKTTLYNLLLGLYLPDVGAILFDGVDSRQIKRQSFRSQIAVVPQDRGLFNESILYNLRYGKPQATLEEVIVAAQVANIHEFIMSLPNGYETMVGERGLKLSGGQVQRILIARAALRDPKILLLDEATSDLDLDTKLTVLEALQNVTKDRTTLIISHEFSPLTKSADVILVLEKGKLVQQGKHQDLINQPGLYQDLWQQAKSIFD